MEVCRIEPSWSAPLFRGGCHLATPTATPTATPPPTPPPTPSHAAKALRRASELLRPRTAVALLNGDIDAVGLSAPFVYEEGTYGEAERALQDAGVRLVTPTTGVPVELNI